MQITRQELFRLISDAYGAFSRMPGNGSGTSEGHSDPAVGLASSATVDAEMLGLPSFGVSMLGRELRRIDGLRRQVASSGFDASAVSDAVGIIDATLMPGQLAVAQAAIQAMAKARRYGVSAIGIRHAGATGMLGSYARYIARNGMVGVILAQSPALVAPFGGDEPAIGTNPMAMGFPRNGSDAENVRRRPLVLDYSTARITLGALKEHRRSGARLPADVAIDSAGEPTVDPDKVSAILPRGLAGSLQGLSIELIARALIGDSNGLGRGTFVLVLDPDRFAGSPAGDSDVAAECERICKTWRDSGGHVPSRYDRLDDIPDDTVLDISDDEIEQLRSLKNRP